MDEIIMPEVNIPEEYLQPFKEAMDAMVEQIKVIVDAASGWWDSILKCCGNKRVVHLAFHAKKKRTRKKNRNRLLKDFLQKVTLETAKGNT